MSSLFAEKNTAFRHSLWDRFDFTAFLNSVRKLKDLDFKQRQSYQYSVVQDSYYALLGRPPLPNLGNAAVTLWEHTLEAAWFTQLQKLFKQDKTGKRLAVKTLSDIYALRISQQNYQPEDAEMQARRKEVQEILNQLQKCKENPQASEDGQSKPSQEGENNNESDEQAQSQGRGEEGGDDSQPQQTAGNDGQPSQAQPGMGTGQSQTGQTGQPTGQSVQAVPSVEYQHILAGEYVPYQDIGPSGKYKVRTRGPNETEKEIIQERVERAEDKYQSLSALLPYVQGKGEERLDNAESLLSHLDASAIAKFLGFAMRAVRGAHRLTDSTVGELTRYKNVVWSEKLHPVDMVGLANGDPRTKVRMAEGSLRERRFKDKNPKGRGPVIVLRDETGSMTAIGGEKNQQARALEIALAHAFNADRRDLVSIAWGDTRTRMCVYGEDNVQTHLSAFINGNDTIIQPALELGIRKTAEYVDGADILIVTDGVIRDSLSPGLMSLVEQFHQTNGRIWVVLVGDPIAMTRYHRVKTLEECLPWADGVIHLDQISDDKALGDLLTRMNRKELSLKGKKVAV